MCQSIEDLKSKAEWDGAEGESRHHLLSELSSKPPNLNRQQPQDLTATEHISPSVMLPEHRLAILLQQVKRNQISNCIYHNTAISPSLYQDHSCDRSNFPLRVIAEITTHTDEVWDVEFSHDGSRIASCGADGHVLIYDANSNREILNFSASDTGVCSLSWSPDDSMLVTCSQDKRARLWNTSVSWSSP